MTATAGSIYTASQFNTHTRDNLLALRATPEHHCDVYHNATQSVLSGATDVVNLNTEATDTSTMHDTATNNERITIPSGGGGKYHIVGHVHRSSGTGNGRLSIRKNGTNMRIIHSSSEVDSLVAVTYLSLAAADYVEMAYTAVSNTTTIGSAVLEHANRLLVYGPLPPS